MKRWALSAIATALIVGCVTPHRVDAQRNPQKGAAKAAAPISWKCFANVPVISSLVPNDGSITDQPTLNCFAWQEFIGLNWAAAPGQRGVADPKATPAQFGVPSAPAPKVWETYKADSEVFLPGGKKPPSWNSPPPSPSCGASNAARAALAKPSTRILALQSAFDDFRLDQTAQASGQWLADQSGNVVWYEIHLNQDEFNTIVENQFYNATVQATTASTGTNPSGGAYQVMLPSGCNQGSCPNGSSPVAGAIELKAAWRVLTNPSQYGRYLTAQAVLVNGGTCTTATMGLVGLHIIHKTVTQPQFIWATFEQVDNVPPANPASFAGSSCTCQTAIPPACFATPPTSTVYQNCTAGESQGQACAPNTPPPYNTISATCKAYPIQVTRERPISSTNTDPIAQTNASAQQLILASNPKSVFQYYQLVDVLWSVSPQNSYTNSAGTPGPVKPLSMSGATPDPSALPVANTTMETYVQNKTCLSCHVNARVAGGSNYASDFSFLFGKAQAPGQLTAAPRSLPAGLVTVKH